MKPRREMPSCPVGQNRPFGSQQIDGLKIFLNNPGNGIVFYFVLQSILESLNGRIGCEQIKLSEDEPR